MSLPFVSQSSTFLLTLQDSQEREFSLLLDQSLSPAVRLELYPKSTVDIYITVLETDGTAATLAASITAASLALADAGVEMVDVVAAYSVVRNDFFKNIQGFQGFFEYNFLFAFSYLRGTWMVIFV